MGPTGRIESIAGAQTRLRMGIAVDSIGFGIQIVWLLLLAAVVDSVFVDGDDLAAVIRPLTAMAVLPIATAGLAIGSQWLLASAGNMVTTDLRSSLADDIAAKGPTEVERLRVGSMATNITITSRAIGDYVARFQPVRMIAVIGPTLVVLAVAFIDLWTVAILAFASAMLVLLLALIGRRTRDLTDLRQAELTWLGAFYLDMLSGLPTLRAHGRQTDATAAISEVSRRHAATTMEVLKSAFQTSLVMEWASTAATALVAVQVSFRLMQGHTSYGNSLAVLLLTPLFFRPLRQLAAEYHVGQAAGSAASELTELLEATGPAASDETPETESDPIRVKPAHTSAGTTTTTASAIAPIEFQGVSFSHGQELVLDRLSFTVEPGQTSMLVGPSGAGKSTVLALLMKFSDPANGRILTGTQNLADLDARTWRSRVAYVPQRPHLFMGTVGENIALAEPGASPEEIEAAIHSIGAESTLLSLPEGLHTEVGERGHRLSTGERQLVAMARAAMTSSELLVFDEFTAHLSPVNEQRALIALEHLCAGRTTLLVAHRMSTIAIADAQIEIPSLSPVVSGA